MADEKGFNKGWAIAALGIIILIAVIVLKFAGPGELPLIGEYPSEINPNGHISYHFFIGIAVGLIVMVIGGAMAMTKGEPAVEEEIEDKLEEAEEGICPTCGAVIPIDSEECPECGEELEPPEEEFEEEEEELEEQECPICGAEVPGDAEECPECGEPLGIEEDVFEDL